MDRVVAELHGQRRDAGGRRARRATDRVAVRRQRRTLRLLRHVGVYATPTSHRAEGRVAPRLVSQANPRSVFQISVRSSVRSTIRNPPLAQTESPLPLFPGRHDAGPGGGGGLRRRDQVRFRRAHRRVHQDPTRGTFHFPLRVQAAKVLDDAVQATCNAEVKFVSVERVGEYTEIRPEVTSQIPRSK